jgi:hypothetical protein
MDNFDFDVDTPKHAYSEGRLEDARRLLLEQYSRKPVRRLIQIDGHRTNDDMMRPDEDGHSLMAGEDYGLYNIAGTPTLPVRVQIYEGADKQEVLTLLGKIADWVERDFYNFVLRASGPEDPSEDLPF